MRKKIPAILCFFWISLGLPAQPRILIDSIPTAASFAGVTPLTLPFADANQADPKNIEEGLNRAITSMLPAAQQQGFSYICLLSAAGDDPIEIPITAAQTKLRLSRKGTAIDVVFYRGGREPANSASYSMGAPESKSPHVSTIFKKIAVPTGGSTAGWVYFNLTRVQGEAEKSKSPSIFISATGIGPLVPVPIPGMKTALMVPDEKSTLNVSWYIPADTKPSDKIEILGHPINGEERKPESVH
jgi:hypothetical protein